MDNNKYYKLYEDLNNILYNYTNELSISHKKIMLKMQIEFLEIAAYSHDSRAQFNLALMYEESNYLIPNPFYNKKKYEMWLREAVNNGNIDAIPNLVNVYLWNEKINDRRLVEGLSLLFVAFTHNSRKGELPSLNYENILKHLRKKKSDLRKLLLIELQNLPDSGKQFLEIHPDYAKAIERFYPISMDE